MKFEVLKSFMTTAADLSALQLFLHDKDSDMFKTLLCMSEAKLSFNAVKILLLAVQLSKNYLTPKEKSIK